MKNVIIILKKEERESLPYSPFMLNTSSVCNQLILLTNLVVNRGCVSLKITKSPFGNRIKRLDLEQLAIKGFNVVINNFYDEHKTLRNYEYLITPNYNDPCCIRIINNYSFSFNFLKDLLKGKVREYVEAINNSHAYAVDYLYMLAEESKDTEKAIKFLHHLQENLINGKKIEIEQQLIDIITSLL